MKHLAKIQSEFIRSAGVLKNVIDEIKNQDKPSIFLGGSCDDNNAWRKNIKDKFDDFFFVDPYDIKWSPEENIYEELAALLNVDHIIFYSGGEGTKKEKTFLNDANKEYKEFDDLNELKAYLKAIKL